MIRYAPKRLYAALLLLILLAAYAGQKVHIYNEDHAHFSAHCGDLVPDNGAHTIIVDRCIIDDFYFFPYPTSRRPCIRSMPGCWPCCCPRQPAANSASRRRAFRCVRLPWRSPNPWVFFSDRFTGCMQPGSYYLLII